MYFFLSDAYARHKPVISGKLKSILLQIHTWDISHAHADRILAI